MRPLFFLTWRSLRGRLIGWLRLIRQPKYLVGALAGVTWMGLFALRPFLRAGRRPDLGAERADALLAWLPVLEIGGALLLLAVLSLWWAWPFGRAVIELTETELHLLLPAPVRRRHIIQYALLRSQGGILFGCLMISFFSTGRTPGPFVWRFVTVWLLLTLWNLHARGRGLWLARLRELPAGAAWRRRGAVVAVVTAVWLVLLPELAGMLASIPDLGGDVGARIGAAVSPARLRAEAPVLWALLLPLRGLTRMVLAGISGELAPLDRLGLLVWPAALLVGHNEWVVRSQARFEDATLDRSRRLAASRDAGARFRRLRRRRRTSAPFALPSGGRPEVAVVWKNLMLAHRMPLPVLVGAGAGLVAAAVAVVAIVEIPGWLIAILTIGGAAGLMMTPLTAGQHWRNDLRSDLLEVELVRAWPLVGWRLFAAQVAAPAAIATLYMLGAAGVLVVAGVAAIRADSGIVLVGRDAAAALGGTPLGALLALLAAAVPLLVTVATLSATLQNLLALVWPSWIQLGKRRSGSAAHIGQGIITSLGLIAAMAIGLLPGAMLSGVWVLVQTRLLGIGLSAWELPLLGLVTAAPLAVIVAALVRFGGVLWDQLDPSAELLDAAGG